MLPIIFWIWWPILTLEERQLAAPKEIDDLVEMAADETRAERSSAAKKVLEAVRDSLEV